MGRLSPSDLRSLYQCCDIGLAAYGQSSNVEMPDKFYDYTAAGLAIICSLKGEVMDLVTQMKLGSSYLAGDTSSLLKEILLLTSDTDLLARYKQNSLSAATEFCISNQRKKLIPFLEECIEIFEKK